MWTGGSDAPSSAPVESTSPDGSGRRIWVIKVARREAVVRSSVACALQKADSFSSRSERTPFCSRRSMACRRQLPTLNQPTHPLLAQIHMRAPRTSASFASPHPVMSSCSRADILSSAEIVQLVWSNLAPAARSLVVKNPSRPMRQRTERLLGMPQVQLPLQHLWLRLLRPPGSAGRRRPRVGSVLFADNVSFSLALE